MSRVVLVTGASSGLGRAIAAHLAAQGCRVFGTSRDPGAHMPPGVTSLVMDVSIASALPMPMQGFYSASKAGLAAITHSLRLEVAPMGVDVVLVEPGNYRTQITAQRQRTDAPPAYATMLERAISTIARDEISGNDPSEVARLVDRIVHARRRRALYRVGPWPERLFLALAPLLPRRLLDALMSNYYSSE